jgi:4a-hydroxytetrahydrobiopterin dehydratase
MADPGLPDWRLVLDRLHASFRAASPVAAAAFAQRVVQVVVADLDLRPSGLVHLSVPAGDEGSARAISELAAADHLAAERLQARTVEVGIDALDIEAVKPFWRAVLGYVDDGELAIVDPERIGPPFWFQQMDEPRPQRNRLHVDVTVPHDAADERVEAALAAGGVLVTDRFARSWWVLADPEGNEACVCTWQDRG